jgi:hypothetical protein
MLRGLLQFRDVSLLQHDCAILGWSAGSCLIDLKTHQVLGMHLTGRYLEAGTAIPMWLLRDDSLLREAGATFAGATSQEREVISRQVERLARSRYWAEARSAIGNLHQRAFGPDKTPDFLGGPLRARCTDE